jgi:protein FAM32A
MAGLGQELPEGYVLAAPNPGADRRTAAEKRHDELMAKKEAERVKKWAAKSHRERINEFNTYLQELSEHHDIPKVGPG